MDSGCCSRLWIQRFVVKYAHPLGKSTKEEVVKTNDAPKLNIIIKGQRELAKVEVLRNSTVIKEYNLSNNEIAFSTEFVDTDFKKESEELYYYIRATQRNNEIAWSSPVWINLT